MIDFDTLFVRLGKVGHLPQDVNDWRYTGKIRLHSLVGNGTTATATAVRKHGLSTGDTVTISGAANTSLNGSKTITVTSSVAFTYTTSVNATDTGVCYVEPTAGAGIMPVFAQLNNLLTTSYSDNPSLVDDLLSARNSYYSAHSGLISYLQNLAEATVIDAVAKDVPQISKTIGPCMRELVKQAFENGKHVLPNTFTTTTTVGPSNVGTAVLAVTLLNNDGRTSQHTIPETLLVQCVEDSQTGRDVGKETYTVTGYPSNGVTSEAFFPSGSALNTRINALAETDTLLSNGSFNTFTVSNTPDAWGILVGSAGTSILNGLVSNTLLNTGLCLRIVGDGSELTALKQDLGVASSSDGSTYKLLPSKQYMVSLWMKASAAPSAGVMRVSLVDNTTVTTDTEGNDNKFDIDLTTLTTSYACFRGFFRTGKVLPTTPRIKIALTTALESGKSVYVDSVILAETTPLYTGGPTVVVVSGTKAIVDDYFKLRIVSSEESLWVKALDQLLNIRSLDLLMPVDATPAISESLLE